VRYCWTERLDGPHLGRAHCVDVAVQQFADVWPGEVVEQALTAAGGSHRRVAVWCSLLHGRADVGFETLYP